MSNKISIRFYKDSQVRAVWSEEQNKWFFSIVDVVKTLPAKNITAFLDWFTYSDNSIDGQSRKKAYLRAMHESTTDTTSIRNLLLHAMTDRSDDREMFMKGIDYSYYYEQL